MKAVFVLLGSLAFGGYIVSITKIKCKINKKESMKLTFDRYGVKSLMESYMFLLIKKK